MTKAKDELAPQAIALEKLTRAYFHGSGSELLNSLPKGCMPFFTGTGPGVDAAAIAALHCQHLTLSALALEMSEIGDMPAALLSRYTPLIAVSAAGESGELTSFLRKVEQGPLLVVTNSVQSTLALSANQVFPMHSGEETPITANAYLNSLALLWLMCRRMGSAWDDHEEDLLKKAINRVHVLQQGKASILNAWHDVLEDSQRLIFTGQGPQTVSARHGAAVMAGLARTSVLAVTLSSYSNGFIELSEPGMGAVIFANSERGLSREFALADELDGYGVNVLLMIDGMPRRIRETPPPAAGFDPYLSTLLDAIAPQLWAIEISHKLNGASEKPRRTAPQSNTG